MIRAVGGVRISRFLLYYDDEETDETAFFFQSKTNHVEAMN